MNKDQEKFKFHIIASLFTLFPTSKKRKEKQFHDKTKQIKAMTDNAKIHSKPTHLDIGADISQPSPLEHKLHLDLPNFVEVLKSI